MSPSSSKRQFASAFRASVPLQIVLIASLWALGEALAHLGRIPVPGGLIGLGVLLLLLATRFVEPRLVSRGAYCLIGEMLLFFVPAILALGEHREFMGYLGFKVLGIVAGGTLAVMIGTAVAVDLSVSGTRRNVSR